MTPYPSGVVTLVFTDIQGSSDLWEEHREVFGPVLDEHNRLMREAAARWQGYEAGTEGDAFFLVFSRPSSAVRFAVDAQQALAGFDWTSLLPSLRELRVRIGMHTGVPLEGEDAGRRTYHGPPTNRAARVSSAGHGGQILLSGATRALAQPELPPEITLLDRGMHRLKGVGEEHLWQVCHPALSREFPPLKTLNPVKHNLPLPATDLVGRGEEIAEWHALLRRPGVRLLTLVGFGGMGKTRSALHLAELCVDDFPDGVWWVDLEEVVTAEAALERIAYDLSARLETRAPVADQVAVFLKERHLLLVLDNTEQIPDVGRTVAGLLNAAPRVKCVITSRLPLGIRHEHLAQVPPLPAAEAERLFEERAAARDPGFAIQAANRESVRELCRRLEGVPLAIELAASRIRGLTPHMILQRLDQPFRLLQQRAPDLHPRQQALRTAIDWSHDLLSEEDRSVFAQLSVFSGGAALEAIEEICEGFDVFDSAMRLLDHSFLRAETCPETQTRRFTMLETVRAYAAEKLREDPERERATGRRHAEYYLGFARERAEKLHTREEAAALGELEREIENVRAGMDWVLHAGEHEIAARYALAFGPFLQRLGFLPEAVRRVSLGLEAVERQADPCARLGAELLLERAGLHLDAFQWPAARELAGEALSLFKALDEWRGNAEALNLIGLAAIEQRDFVTARQCLTTALTEAMRAGDRVMEANSMNNLGLVEQADEAGDRNRAASHWQAARTLYDQAGDRRGLAGALNNLGLLAQDADALDQARAYYEEALQLEEALQHAFGAARALSNLGEIADLQEEGERALRLFAAAEALFARVGSPYRTYTGELFQRAAARPSAPEGAPELRAGLGEKSLGELIRWATASGPTAESV